MTETNLSNEDVAKVLEELAECVLRCGQVAPDLLLRADEAELYLIDKRKIEALEVLHRVTFALRVEEARCSPRFQVAEQLLERAKPVDSLGDSIALRVLAAELRDFLP